MHIHMQALGIGRVIMLLPRFLEPLPLLGALCSMIGVAPIFALRLHMRHALTSAPSASIGEDSSLRPPKNSWLGSPSLRAMALEAQKQRLHLPLESKWAKVGPTYLLP